MAGHRVLISAQLVDTGEGGVKNAIVGGSRSVAYLFEPLDDGEQPNGFGGVVEEVIEGGAPGGDLTAIVRFWAELAEVYATPGTQFDLWLGRVVGHGVVKEVLPD